MKKINIIAHREPFNWLTKICRYLCGILLTSLALHSAAASEGQHPVSLERLLEKSFAQNTPLKISYIQIYQIRKNLLQKRSSLYTVKTRHNKKNHSSSPNLLSRKWEYHPAEDWSDHKQTPLLEIADTHYLSSLKKALEWEVSTIYFQTLSDYLALAAKAKECLLYLELQEYLVKNNAEKSNLDPTEILTERSYYACKEDKKKLEILYLQDIFQLKELLNMDQNTALSLDFSQITALKTGDIPVEDLDVLINYSLSESSELKQLSALSQAVSETSKQTILKRTFDGLLTSREESTLSFYGYSLANVKRINLSKTNPNKINTYINQVKDALRREVGDTHTKLRDVVDLGMIQDKAAKTCEKQLNMINKKFSQDPSAFPALVAAKIAFIEAKSSALHTRILGKYYLTKLARALGIDFMKFAKNLTISLPDSIDSARIFDCKVKTEVAKVENSNKYEITLSLEGSPESLSQIASVQYEFSYFEKLKASQGDNPHFSATLRTTQNEKIAKVQILLQDGITLNSIKRIKIHD